MKLRVSFMINYRNHILLILLNMVNIGMPIAKKRKLCTILEADLFKSLKLRAVEENRPMADVISDAIEQYLARRQAEDERPIGFQKLLKHPAGQASLTDVRAVLEEDTC